ncbi:hypothetical protein ACFQV2_34140 [Actinokineospora soli]|uniref:Uncharacterized protein n=1 Tax=Actinokineospora soli TaxID=1048753 RepID=A0ABW2TXA3_9PSEU
MIDAPDWRGGLAQWCWAYLGMLRAHPWILHVPISAPPPRRTSSAGWRPACGPRTGSGCSTRCR